MNCHLLIPGLLLPPGTGSGPYEGLALPALETLLARGSLTRFPGGSLEQWLATAFRIAPERDLPLAALSLRGDGVDPGRSCWIQADPVHLEVRRDALALAAAGQLDITAREATEITAALNAHFAPEGLAFQATLPHRWYARLAAAPRIRTTPTAEVNGLSIAAHLPVGEDGARWRRLMNEAQMLLHGLPCNAAREERGRPAINSIWFWGAGHLPEVPREPSYGAIWASHPLAAGIAAAAGLELHMLPLSATEFLAAAPPQRPVLIVIDALRAAAGTGPQAWRQALLDVERLWCHPLLNAMRRRIVTAVTLHALGARRSCMATTTRLDCWKVWRQRRPLHAYCEGAAA
jgi:hypothetical protein